MTPTNRLMYSRVVFPSMNLIRDTWVLSAGLMMCRALRTVLFEQGILFLFEHFVWYFLVERVIPMLSVH